MPTGVLWRVLRRLRPDLTRLDGQRQLRADLRTLPTDAAALCGHALLLVTVRQ